MLKKITIFFLVVHLILIGLSGYINYLIKSYEVVHLEDLTKDHHFFKSNNSYRVTTKNVEWGITLFNAIGKYSWVDALCWNNQAAINAMFRMQIYNLNTNYEIRYRYIRLRVDKAYDDFKSKYRNNLSNASTSSKNSNPSDYQAKFKVYCAGIIDSFDAEFVKTAEEIILNINKISPLTKEETQLWENVFSVEELIDNYTFDGAFLEYRNIK